MDGSKVKGKKSYDIRKRLIVEAWEKVQSNAGAPGVDAVSTTEFASKEKGNLYKLWNVCHEHTRRLTWRR